MERVKCFRRFTMPTPLAWLLLIFLPLLFAFIIVNFWLYLRPHLPKFDSDDNMIFMTFTALVAAIYIIPAGRSVETVWKRFEQVELAKDNEDKLMFIKTRYKRVPNVFLRIVGILSLVSLSLFFMITYHRQVAGIIMIGFWSALMAFLLLIVLELEDPISGFWKVKIEEDWLVEKAQVIQAAKTTTVAEAA